MAVGSLDSALTGLRIAQQQINTIATNVSNVGTPGYTRKILPQSTVAIDGTAVGVRADTLIRKVDMNLSRDLWTQISGTSSLSVKADYLNQIQQFHGAPEKELSVASEVARLKDSFSSLSDDPGNGFLLKAGVDEAVKVADKINDFADLLSQMRNDTQTQISVAVGEINSSLTLIADLNQQIKSNLRLGKSIAALEDSRDETIKTLSQQIEITFFTRGDGVLVVQTSQGQQLADENPEELFFSSTPLSATNSYPATAAGLYLGGDPAHNPNAVDITQTNLGGAVGGLFELRDQTLPTYQAQLDEMAHKMALRFEAQGLRLFTAADGSVPGNADAVPDLITPPGTPVSYVGFSNEIRVNKDILADYSLLRTGTVSTDLPVASGSNEVIRRVVEFVFGPVDHQEAVGTVDIRSNATGATRMQNWLGLYSQNTVKGRTDMTLYSDINAIISAGGDVFTPPAAPVRDQFRITFQESRTATGPVTITIDLSDAQANFPLGPGITNSGDQIAAEINSQIALAGVPASLAAVASVSPYGQIVIESRGQIAIDASSFVGGMGDEGLEFLGLEEGTYETTDPWFDVQVGNANSVRVTIEPQDTETQLIDKLEWDSATRTGVPGLFVDVDGVTGALTLRPGNDDSNGGPVFGGDITLTGGPFETLAPANPQLGAAFPPAGTGIGVVTALFGAADPISDIAHPAFKETNLGPDLSVSLGITGSSTLVDIGQKIVNRHAEEVNLVEAQYTDELSFQDLLQRQLSDESGVNLDEEMAHLIVVQTAFAAAARTVTAIDDMFKELLNAI